MHTLTIRLDITYAQSLHETPCIKSDCIKFSNHTCSNISTKESSQQLTVSNQLYFQIVRFPYQTATMKVLALLCILSATLYVNEVGAQNATVNLKDCVASNMKDRQVCSDEAYEICQKKKMVPICCPNTNAAPECVCCQGWSRPDTSTTTCPCDGRKASPKWCYTPSEAHKLLI